VKVFLKGLVNRGNPIDLAKGKSDVERFRSWLQKGGMIMDRNKYMIDGKECVDHFIRFENLLDDINHVCDHLSIPFEPAQLPKFKMGFRTSTREIGEYYDQKTIQIVQELFAWELERFGYTLPD
jgi:hypothetical protein